MILHRRYSIRGVLGLAQTGTALARGVGQFDPSGYLNPSP